MTVVTANRKAVAGWQSHTSGVHHHVDLR